jgi:hypothetical protein
VNRLAGVSKAISNQKKFRLFSFFFFIATKFIDTLRERAIENIKDKNWMDILSSGDPFGKRRLPVDGGIVVISPKAHRLFRPDGIDQAT